MSSILAQSHTFVEIVHEIISMVILLPSADSRRVVVSYKRKYVHKVLVNRLVKFTQEKSLVRCRDFPRSDFGPNNGTFPVKFYWWAIKATNMLQLYTANFLYGFKSI